MVYQNFSSTQGGDFINYISIINPDSTPVNVATYLFTGQMKTSFFTANVAANLIMTIVDAPNGNIAMSMNAATTANLSAGTYVYDVVMNDNLGNTSRILNGKIFLQSGVTNIIPPNSGLPA